jgi:myo-inositol-1(or 4)-monophosphatase
VTISAVERADLAAVALLVAEEAADLVARGHRSRPVATEKARSDLVTQFDRASEELLLSRLASLTPGVPIVAEESASGERPAGLVWCVDPLDGTTNFVHGHPFWCVSVGLMDGGAPVAGAVVAPILGVRWRGVAPAEADSASRGARASSSVRNDAPCSVSATADLRDALLATGFPAARDREPDNNFASFIRVKRAAQGVRRCGSAAIDLCMVADGTYDAYWERQLHVWDVAAGSAIVLGAGGVVTSLSGGVPDFDIGHIVASNGHLHADVVKALTEPSGSL